MPKALALIAHKLEGIYCVLFDNQLWYSISLTLLVGLLITVGGTYACVVEIIMNTK